MLLLCLWILWVGNLDRTQRGQLVSVPQSLRPYLGTCEDWGWLSGRGQKPSKGLLTGMLVINAGCQRGPQLLTWDCWPECTYVAAWVSSQHGSEIPRGLRGSSLVTWPQKSHHVTCAIVRNPPRFSWGGTWAPAGHGRHAKSCWMGNTDVVIFRPCNLSRGLSWRTH